MAVTRRVLIADDHAMVRASLAALITAADDLILVGEARDGVEAVKLAHATDPDVVLMDVTMPGLDGIRAATRLAAELPHVKVIILTAVSDPWSVAAARDVGVAAHLAKDGEPSSLLTAIRRVFDQEDPTS